MNLPINRFKKRKSIVQSQSGASKKAHQDGEVEQRRKLAQQKTLESKTKMLAAEREAFLIEVSSKFSSIMQWTSNPKILAVIMHEKAKLFQKRLKMKLALKIQQ